MPTTPDPTPTPAAAAERASRRRTRMLWVFAIMFIVWQTSIYQWGMGPPVRAVEWVKIGGWVAWAVVLLAVLATGGGWWERREVRRILNDEGAVANRQAGQRAGFWGAMVAAVTLYVISLFEPVTARDAVHAILTAGVGAALFRYATLERKAERGA